MVDSNPSWERSASPMGWWCPKRDAWRKIQQYSLKWWFSGDLLWCRVTKTPWTNPSISKLVGGINPSEKYDPQIESSPQVVAKPQNIWNDHLNKECSQRPTFWVVSHGNLRVPLARHDGTIDQHWSFYKTLDSNLISLYFFGGKITPEGRSFSQLPIIEGKLVSPKKIGRLPSLYHLERMDGDRHSH